MPKRKALLRRAAIAALAAAPLLLPLYALAQTDQPAGAANAAKPQPKKQKQPAATKEAVGAPLDLTVFATNLAAPVPAPTPPTRSLFSLFTSDEELCPDGYHSYTPPCMGTYPQADPNYHGPGGR